MKVKQNVVEIKTNIAFFEKKFWKFLLWKGLPLNSLENVQCTIFGLGDSSYPKFCFVAKLLHRRLESLGAKIFHDRGFGDDQDLLGYDGCLDKWLPTMWSSLEKIYPNVKPLDNGNDLMDQPKYLIQMDRVEINNNNSTPKVNGKYTQAKLIENTRITSNKWEKDVRKILFEMDNKKKYECGDVLCVLAENDEAKVLDALKILGLDPKNQILSIKINPSYSFFESSEDFFTSIPFPITILDFFVKYVNLFGIFLSFFAL